ncbi:hypothetical protein AB0I66_41675 [Streptomyces sp. NPDC050439]|uniref:hypothetical protein n=1 Tax=unclassified Streptomyces TaxID=2593676 RepID=UPI003448EED9
MTYVRPHRRRDGTYVKGHHRRTRPRAAQSYTSPSPAPARRSPSRPGPAATGPTTYVAPYSRADGTHVRGHHRSISPRTVAVATGSGGGFLLLILVLLALTGGPGDSSNTPADPKPAHSTTAPTTQNR